MIILLSLMRNAYVPPRITGNPSYYLFNYKFFTVAELQVHTWPPSSKWIFLELSVLLRSYQFNLTLKVTLVFCKKKSESDWWQYKSLETLINYVHCYFYGCVDTAFSILLSQKQVKPNPNVCILNNCFNTNAVISGRKNCFIYYSVWQRVYAFCSDNVSFTLQWWQL